VCLPSSLNFVTQPFTALLYSFIVFSFMKIAYFEKKFN